MATRAWLDSTSSSCPAGLGTVSGWVGDADGQRDDRAGEFKRRPAHYRHRRAPVTADADTAVKALVVKALVVKALVVKALVVKALVVKAIVALPA